MAYDEPAEPTVAPEIEAQKPLVPFNGVIKRSSSPRFQVQETVSLQNVPTDPLPIPVVFSHTKSGGVDVFDPVLPQSIEGVHMTSANGDFSLISFRHPTDPKRLVTVVLESPDSQPGPHGEVDGVWVAEEGEGEEPPDA